MKNYFSRFHSLALMVCLLFVSMFITPAFAASSSGQLVAPVTASAAWSDDLIGLDSEAVASGIQATLSSDSPSACGQCHAGTLYALPGFADTADPAVATGTFNVSLHRLASLSGPDVAGGVWCIPKPPV